MVTLWTPTATTASTSGLILDNTWDTTGTAASSTVLFDDWRIGSSETASTFLRRGYTDNSNSLTNGGPWPEFALPLRPPRPLPQLPRNHRGNHLRALSLGRQFDNARPEELLALQLLRQMVDTDQFRRYLKYGFVTVRGPSGLTYQVRRREHHIIVWDRGTRVADLCVYLRNVPPTDEVVAKLIMCECDELDVWRRANVHWCVFGDARTQHKALVALGVTQRTRADTQYRRAA